MVFSDFFVDKQSKCLYNKHVIKERRRRLYDAAGTADLAVN